MTFNRATLIGHLGADPEIRHTQDGRPIANLRLATSESWKDKNSGERKERTEWHRIVIFSEGLAKVAQQWLKKGSKVLIEGQIQTRKWQDQAGQDKHSTEIVLQGFSAKLVMLDSAGGEKRESGVGDSTEGASSADYRNAREGTAGPAYDDMDDQEIPF